jgi:hypothetical protein
MDADYWHKSM